MLRGQKGGALLDSISYPNTLLMTCRVIYTADSKPERAPQPQRKLVNELTPDLEALLISNKEIKRVIASKLGFGLRRGRSTSPPNPRASRSKRVSREGSLILLVEV